jgi:hypothetical protein
MTARVTIDKVLDEIKKSGLKFEIIRAGSAAGMTPRGCAGLCPQVGGSQSLSSLVG